MAAEGVSRAVHLIELIGLTRVHSAVPPLTAVDEVDLVVDRGDWWSITGPSGSGKSTLLSLIGLLDAASSGTYLLNGQDVTALSDVDRSRLRGELFGFVFQQFHLLDHRTATENVMLAEVYAGPTARRGAARHHAAVEVLERVGLGDRLDAYPRTLSGGERQRVAIARALMSDPAVLLCDEPTGNLDSENTLGVLELLADVADSGQTIIVVTHDPLVAQSARQHAVMLDGALAIVEPGR